MKPGGNIRREVEDMHQGMCGFRDTLKQVELYMNIWTYNIICRDIGGLHSFVILGPNQTNH